MLYGFNPILPAYADAGTVWGSKVPSRDFSVFGVTGSDEDSRRCGTVKVREEDVPRARRRSRS